MLVRVAETGSHVKELELENGATVRDALDKAGLTGKSHKEIRVNGTKSDLTTPLRNDDIILLIPRVEGGA